MAKKSFKYNPALQFISSADDAHNEKSEEQTHNTDYTDNKQYTDNEYNKHERKSKRLNLLLKPSILANLNKIAYMKQTSVNDLINSVLNDYSEREKETVSMYDKIFAEKL